MKLLFSAGCAVLLIGAFSTGTVSAQDPLGRCCYSEGYTASCAMLTEAECMALDMITWDEELNCTDDPCGCCDTPGDCNDDGAVNILDVMCLLRYQYSIYPYCEPPCMDQCDANGNSAVSILDVTRIISYLYKSGIAPVCGTTGE